ncbi:MAG: GxxExxY protein [Prevotella sp.]|nr:GxxExxY protein [Prevotella sp.]MDY4625673.1 GxxExxY protein [Prevotella sp.]
MTENEITYKIRHAIFDVYNELGPGLLESVYQEAMTYQMRIDGLKVDEQVSVPVIYKGQLLQKADLKLDLLVEGCVIVELKSVAEMKKVFFKQLQTYLKLSKLHCGILVNFNTDNIIDSIHRVFNGYK